MAAYERLLVDVPDSPRVPPDLAHGGGGGWEGEYMAMSGLCEFLGIPCGSIVMMDAVVAEMVQYAKWGCMWDGARVWPDRDMRLMLGMSDEAPKKLNLTSLKQWLARIMIPIEDVARETSADSRSTGRSGSYRTPRIHKI